MRRHISTDAIHVGEHPEMFNHSVVPGILPATIFEFESFAHYMEHVKSGKDFVYTRGQNPTRFCLEEKLASLEESQSAIALSSGMSAVTVALLSAVKAGQTVIAQKHLYGNAVELMRDYLPNLGIKSIQVDAEKLYDLSWVPDQTSVVYIETPSNPTLRVTDIRKAVQAAKARGLTVIADNTFATPVFQKPLKLGVDLVVHSATKYLGGHSDVLGGVICGNSDLIEKCRNWQVVTGCVLDPFSSYLLMRGIKTLTIRMAKAQSNTMKVARYLADSKKIAKVYYPGLYNDPDHSLAASQMSGYGAMVSFEPVGGMDSTIKIFDSLNLIRRAGSLGGVESTISIPSVMSHHSLSPQEQIDSGIKPELMRLSVGIEDEVDLLTDLDQALGKLP
jgi:cystathionine beta-lyase/cystathionine gamma-synthase